MLFALTSLLCLHVGSAAATTETFGYTGAEQTFEVPSGVHDLRVRLVGGSGGEAGQPGVDPRK